jgi:hypothetical protein
MKTLFMLARASGISGTSPAPGRRFCAVCSRAGRRSFDRPVKRVEEEQKRVGIGREDPPLELGSGKRRLQGGRVVEEHGYPGRQAPGHRVRRIHLDAEERTGAEKVLALRAGRLARWQPTPAV